MNGKLRPWTFVVGAVFWAMMGVGIATKQTALIVAAVALAATTVAMLLVRKSKRVSVLHARRKDVWDNGVAGAARVLSIHHDGGGINGDPEISFELEVRPADGEPYELSTSAIIDKICLPQVQPDNDIRVRIDPNDKNFVVIDEKITSPWYLPR